MLAGACHVLYSPLGFNPTDDGFQLALARRVWEGEIPHRDFVDVRPGLSAYLWAPLAAMRSDRVLLWGRWWVWVQWAAIAWMWSRLYESALRFRLLPAERLAAAGVTFLLGAHSFPVMPWHTIDGLFFLSLGAYLAQSSCHGQWGAAWLAVGCAPLFKQGYLPGAVLVLGASPERFRVRGWLLAGLPALIFAGWLAAKGALWETWNQMSANASRLLTVGFLVYPVVHPLFGVVVAAGAIAAWSIRSLGERRLLRLGAILVAGGSVLPPVCWWVLFQPSIGAIHLFALALGLLGGATVACALGWGSAHLRRVLPVALAAVGTSWASAISVAVNYPGLAAGILWLTSVSILFPWWIRVCGSRRSRTLLACVLLVATAVIFHEIRLHAIYRDRPARELSVPLDGILPGARGIRTNARTAAMLGQLRDVATSLSRQGRAVAVLPDCAALWVASGERPPLPVTWDNEVELPTETLRRRVRDAIAARACSLTILVSRYETEELAWRLVPLRPRYPVTQWVRQHFRKIAETEFFELYESSGAESSPHDLASDGQADVPTGETQPKSGAQGNRQLHVDADDL